MVKLKRINFRLYKSNYILTDLIISKYLIFKLNYVKRNLIIIEYQLIFNL